MTESDSASGGVFAAKLRDRLTDLRLRVDLGEIAGPAAFREALGAGGTFRLEDPRVREACVRAGLAAWIT